MYYGGDRSAVRISLPKAPTIFKVSRFWKDIALLSGLPNLTTIEFATQMTREQAAESPLISQLVTAARGVLMKHSGEEDSRRSVRVVGITDEDSELFKTVYV